MRAIITVGVSGSGKSTWASKQKGFHVVNRDDARKFIMEDRGQEFSWKNWKWKDENLVTDLCDAELQKFKEECKNVIISDTNLNYDRMENLRSKLESMGYEVELKFFHGIKSEEDVSIETCLKRDSQRKDSVGFDVIHKQWKQMMDSYGEMIRQQYVPDDSLMSVVLVDIDGTISDHKGIRSPFEWHKVGLDKVIPHVAEIVKLVSSKHKIIFMSGRDSVCRQETLTWLMQQGFEFQDLFMRESGDCRSDDIVKEELFDKHIRGKYNPQYVIDDRPRVCQRWADMGLKVVRVGHINEYF